MDASVTEIAAGGVVLEEFYGQLKVVLCHRYKGQDSRALFALPKGRLESRESIPSASRA